MADFVFAEYVKAIKNVWKGKPRSNEHIITELYGVVSKTMELDGKGDFYIECSKTRASEIMQRKANPHEDIKRFSQEPLVRQDIVQFFEREILVETYPSKQEELLFAMKGLVEGSDVFEQRKTKLLSLATTSSLAQFLAECYLEVLLRDNKMPTDSDKSDEQQLSRFPKLNHLSPPEVPAGKERRYIDALMGVYSEAEGTDCFTVDSFTAHPKHKRHFDRMRRDYYAAESVHRGTRDVFDENEEDQFEVFEEEVYEGVVDTYEDEYDSGMARLREVLKQASQVSVQRSWLSRDTDWIGAAQKKGACHFLVNDGRLEGWVGSDD